MIPGLGAVAQDERHDVSEAAERLAGGADALERLLILVRWVLGQEVRA